MQIGVAEAPGLPMPTVSCQPVKNTTYRSAAPLRSGRRSNEPRSTRITGGYEVPLVAANAAALHVCFGLPTMVFGAPSENILLFMARFHTF
jgi:hypothetical protein